MEAIFPGREEGEHGASDVQYSFARQVPLVSRHDRVFQTHPFRDQEVDASLATRAFKLATASIVFLDGSFHQPKALSYSLLFRI